MRGDPLPLETRQLFLQMGNSHPALHCTAGITLHMDGATVVDASLELGHHHRGFEKMCEGSTYNQCFPYVERLNYLSPAVDSVGLALTVEKLLDIVVPERTQYLRTIIAETGRIQEHLSCLAGVAHSLSSPSAMRLALQARDNYLQLFDKWLGARATQSAVRVGGMRHDLPANSCEDFEYCATGTEELLARIEQLLQRQHLFADRMCGVGIMPRDLALEYGFTGPCLRASGVDYDVRKDAPYLVYDRLDFDVPVGERGDNFDRYLVRTEEIRQSIKMVRQCFEQLPDGPVNVPDWQVVRPPRDAVHGTLEGMVAQFELTIKGPLVPPGEAYGFVEGGNGELGFYLVSDGSGRPYRLHARTPGLALLHGFTQMLGGCGLADVIPTFASINAVGSEIER